MSRMSFLLCPIIAGALLGGCLSPGGSGGSSDSTVVDDDTGGAPTCTYTPPGSAALPCDPNAPGFCEELAGVYCDVFVVCVAGADHAQCETDRQAELGCAGAGGIVGSFKTCEQELEIAACEGEKVRVPDSCEGIIIPAVGTVGPGPEEDAVTPEEDLADDLGTPREDTGTEPDRAIGLDDVWGRDFVIDAIYLSLMDPRSDALPWDDDATSPDVRVEVFAGFAGIEASLGNSSTQTDVIFFSWEGANLPLKVGPDERLHFDFYDDEPGSSTLIYTTNVEGKDLEVLLDTGAMDWHSPAENIASFSLRVSPL